MQHQPIDFALAVDERKHRSHQRLTRQLLLSTHYLEFDVPSHPPLGAVLVREESGELTFWASPRLSPLEVKLAAYGLADRFLQPGDRWKKTGWDCDGLQLATLRGVSRSIRATEGHRAEMYVEQLYFGTGS